MQNNHTIKKFKTRIEEELTSFIQKIEAQYAITQLSPFLLEYLKDFILRSGQHLRPIIFIIAYLGFSDKESENLYSSAISLELLHDFSLTHDDIIDKSSIRLGKASLHATLNNYLKDFQNINFHGEDLAMIIGDILYSQAIHNFLSIKETSSKKEKALKRLLGLDMYTGFGEFIELLFDIKDLEDINKNDIFRIYDLKSTFYTFASPLASGAILGSATKKQSQYLFEYGIRIGRAFQIKSDLSIIFSNKFKEENLSLKLLQEAKRTIPMWYTYQTVSLEEKLYLKQILSSHKITINELIKVQEIIENSGALKAAKEEISLLLEEAKKIQNSLQMKNEYKNLLFDYCTQLVTIK